MPFFGRLVVPTDRFHPNAVRRAVAATPSYRCMVDFYIVTSAALSVRSVATSIRVQPQRRALVSRGGRAAAMPRDDAPPPAAAAAPRLRAPLAPGDTPGAGGAHRCAPAHAPPRRRGVGGAHSAARRGSATQKDVPSRREGGVASRALSVAAGPFWPPKSTSQINLTPPPLTPPDGPRRGGGVAVLGSRGGVIL